MVCRGAFAVSLLPTVAFIYSEHPIAYHDCDTNDVLNRGTNRGLEGTYSPNGVLLPGCQYPDLTWIVYRIGLQLLNFPFPDLAIWL
jgi:hypothetical protein